MISSNHPRFLRAYHPNPKARAQIVSSKAPPDLAADVGVSEGVLRFGAEAIVIFLFLGIGTVVEGAPMVR
jgi:hypothetical protein